MRNWKQHEEAHAKKQHEEAYAKKQHEPRSAQEDLQMQMQLEILLGNVC